jgi:putative Holliday junction resolvase
VSRGSSAARDSGQPVERTPGVWLGVDVGSVRVGVAKSDPNGLLATPLITLRRQPRTDRDLDELAGLVREHDAVGVVIGLPRTLAGREGIAAATARDYGALLQARISPTRIVFMDERLTTVTAGRTLTDGGIRGRAQRAVIDQVAAVLILQLWLDAGRGC